ncbi:protein kinase domain-containing protein [Schlesneria sp.]|uniref:serine/threonine-protein kinase n=1 Tax=Schlesneria sp. TaxID=2762018 RepID=UPI002F0222AA
MANEEQLVDDQYQLAVCIASGGSSQVWEVVEKTSGRHLAMKLLKTDVPDFKENKAQMKRESEIHKTFEHPLIVKFERYSSNRDHTYILMEYFRASNLKLQIKADSNSVHLKVRQLFEGICSALSHVHNKGFIHRDIKPDNVLMNKAGEVRLCDFSLSTRQATGLSKMFGGKLKTIQGTRTYIAPETIRRRQPTIQTDLYSLGVLFFEVLAGKTPFQAPTPEELLQKHLGAEPPNPSEFNPNVTPEMDRIVAKLLKKKPTDRPASVDEVLQELKRIRIFKEDIIDAAAVKKANEDKDALEMLSEVRLDSRADAKLKEMLATNPEFAQKFAEEKLNQEKKKKAANQLQLDRIKSAETEDAARAKGKKGAAPAPAAQPVPPQVAMPMPMPGYPPGFQPYPPGYPGYPQGQMPMMPPQMMPPQMMPPQMMPGMPQPMPGMPQYAPQPPMGNPQAMHQPPRPAAPVPPSGGQPPAVKQGPPSAAATPPGPQGVPQRQPTHPQTPQVQPGMAPVARPTATPPAAPAQRVNPAPVTPMPQPGAGAPPANRPAAPPAKPPAAKTPAGGPYTGPAPRPVTYQTPASPENADLEYMTDLPDIL